MVIGTLMRRVHSYCGLALLFFIAMYAVSGAGIIHSSQLDLAPQIVTERVTLDVVGNPDGAELARYLAGKFGAHSRGEPTAVRENGRWIVSFIEPGGVVRFDVEPNLRSASMERRKGSLVQKLVALHKVSGFEGGLAYTAWGALVDMVSLAMVLFTVTGVYLWFVSTRDRRLGYAVLVASWGFTLAACIIHLAMT